MLLNLHVKNFALIDEADLDFGAGLNVLTGETGAGKSILIDAVNAALGGRVRSDVIRRGEEFAYVELVFSIEDEEKKKALHDLDVETEYDCILISRKIMEGRSQHKINDETVTSAKVRRVTELLLDLHGQHEHQSLLKEQKHLEILDQFAMGDMDQVLGQVAMTFDQYQRKKCQWEDFQIDPEQRAREMDLLAYEVQEIEKAALKPGEKQELMEEYRRYRNAGKIRDALEISLAALEGAGGMEGVSLAIRELRQVSSMDPSLEGCCEQLLTVEDLLQNLCHELLELEEGLSCDPQQQDALERRLDLWNRLEHKYGDGYEAIAKSWEEKNKRLEEFADWERKKVQLEEVLGETEKTLLQQSKRLGEIRRQAAQPLADAITLALKELNFLQVNFRIQIDRREQFSRQGMDRVEFLISTNPGEEPRSLGQVASGGELSRIMLAMKTVLAQRDEIPTLIFDEIDTGISGRTAQKVAEKLNQIGRYRQVICITHLPQIAAMADRHFSIEKKTIGERTRTKVKLLDEKEQVAELARLLSGAEITEAVYHTAHEMKNLACRTKREEVKY